MKIKILICFCFFTFLSSAIFYYIKPKKRDLVFSTYDSSYDDSIKLAKYKHLYEELNWIHTNEKSIQVSNETNHQKNPLGDIYLVLKFLDAILSGEYLQYLDLYIDKTEHRRLTYNEFLRMHQKISDFSSLSIFTKEEFKDVLFYGLILGKIENSLEFKNRAWVYGTDSLTKIILMHAEILPTLKRFSFSQKNFLRVILDGFKFEGFFEKYKNNISYEIGKECSFLKENIEYFDLSFLLFICRMAGKYKESNQCKFNFSSGFYSFIFDFKKDLIVHLQQAS